MRCHYESRLFHLPGKIIVDDVPEPKLEAVDDAILRVTIHSHFAARVCTFITVSVWAILGLRQKSMEILSCLKQGHMSRRAIVWVLPGQPDPSALHR
jgi:hypothetical protein